MLKRRRQLGVLLAVAALGPLAGAAQAAGGGSAAATSITAKGTATTSVGPPPVTAVPQRNPFTGRGMWIWELDKTEGGNVAAIIATAKRYGIRTLLVKSSDGSSYWSQFSRELVVELHEAGLKVCAWQFVYGVNPVAEANLGRRAVRDGANCLVIDAESAYQGRYASASTYMARLRRLIGLRFPVGLAGLPYVDYHLSFPYSVFLGPNGAQYNLPQMYWADIGVSVATVYAHTYMYNAIYRRPIFPLGQLWNSGRGMSSNAIEQFNALATAYGATGVSWWDWQSAAASYFTAMTRSDRVPYGFMPSRTVATIRRGNKGDLVIWAQEHLYGAGARIAIDGIFGPKTQAAVRSFQAHRHMPVTGKIDAATWNALLKIAPVKVTWTIAGKLQKAVLHGAATRTGHTSGTPAAPTLMAPEPAWAGTLPTRSEFRYSLGGGRR